MAPFLKNRNKSMNHRKRSIVDVVSANLLLTNRDGFKFNAAALNTFDS